MKQIFLTLLAIIIATTAAIADETETNVTPTKGQMYSDDNDTFCITLWRSSISSTTETYYILDDTYTKNSSLTVYQIGSSTSAYSFTGEYEIVALGDGEKSILTYTDYASNITTMTLGSKIIEINDYALSTFTSLTILTINTATPPSLGTYAFSGLTTSNITLYVPDDEAVAAYTADNDWNVFKDIVALVSNSSSSAISEIDNDSSIKLAGRTVSLGEEQKVTIYDITGKVVLRTTAQQFSLPQKGIYIIRTENETKKVVVR